MIELLANKFGFDKDKALEFLKDKSVPVNLVTSTVIKSSLSKSMKCSHDESKKSVATFLSSAWQVLRIMGLDMDITEIVINRIVEHNMSSIQNFLKTTPFRELVLRDTKVSWMICRNRLLFMTKRCHPICVFLRSRETRRDVILNKM